MITGCFDWLPTSRKERKVVLEKNIFLSKMCSEPRGKLWRTTGLIPACNMRKKWRGIYGYYNVPSPKGREVNFSYATIMFFDSDGIARIFDPKKHETVDGSYLRESVETFPVSNNFHGPVSG